MESMSKVTQVVGIATKKDGTELKGVGKNGKPWSMYSVILENGTKLNVFGPVEEGDYVYELVQDPQWKSWSGKVKKSGAAPAHDASQPTNATILNAVLELHKLLQRHIDGDKTMTQDEFNKDVILDDIDGEPIDLSGVPF